MSENKNPYTGSGLICIILQTTFHYLFIFTNFSGVFSCILFLLNIVRYCRQFIIMYQNNVTLTAEQLQCYRKSTRQVKTYDRNLKQNEKLSQNMQTTYVIINAESSVLFQVVLTISFNKLNYITTNLLIDILIKAINIIISKKVVGVVLQKFAC